MKDLEDLVKWKEYYYKEHFYKANKSVQQIDHEKYIQQNLYQLQALISQLQSKIKELESELAEANKELELLRPFGIVWRSPKKKDVKVTK